MRRRVKRYASTHAWAFLLWRWRECHADRTHLKQRVRELERVSAHRKHRGF